MQECYESFRPEQSGGLGFPAYRPNRTVSSKTIRTVLLEVSLILNSAPKTFIGNIESLGHADRSLVAHEVVAQLMNILQYRQKFVSWQQWGYCVSNLTAYPLVAQRLKEPRSHKRAWQLGTAEGCTTVPSSLG